MMPLPAAHYVKHDGHHLIVINTAEKATPAVLATLGPLDRHVTDIGVCCWPVVWQSGDEECLAAWQRICAASRKEFEAIYSRLNVTLRERGESFYNPMLKGKGAIEEQSCSLTLVNWLAGWQSCIRIVRGSAGKRSLKLPSSAFIRFLVGPPAVSASPHLHRTAGPG